MSDMIWQYLDKMKNVEADAPARRFIQSDHREKSVREDSGDV